MPIFKNKNSETKKIRRDIQALRALAVMSVVLYHLWPERLIGGFTGVDIFFVISGYLMTTSIMGRLKPLADSSTITPKNVFNLLTEFYARRIKRLVPAALVTLVGVLTLSTLTNNLTIIIDNAKNVISAATFWENWHLAKQSVDYLHQGDAPVATQHFWSLSLEEQFYLMWPLILIFATLITINLVVYYKRSKIAGAILPITLIAIASAAYGYWLTQDTPSVAYFSTPARVWELMIGGIIAFLPTIKNYDLKLLLPHAGLTMCLYSIFFITGDGFPGWHAFIPTLGVALIILGGVDKTESKLAFDSVFRWQPIQWIGDISYSIYLWHWPLIILLPVLIHRDIEGPHGLLFKSGIIILSLIIAHLSYKFIEEPSRKINIKTRHTYLFFILATGLVVLSGFILKNYGEQQTKVRLEAMHAAVINKSNICIGARAIINKDKCDNPFGKINSTFASVGRKDLFLNLIQDDGMPCYGFFLGKKGGENTSKYCTFGDTTSQKTIILLGDSHAEQYINALNDIGKRHNYRVFLLNLGQCTDWAKMKKNKTCRDRLDFIKTSGILDSKSFILTSVLFRKNGDVEKFLNEIKESTKTKLVLLNDPPRTTIKGFTNCYIFMLDCKYNRNLATKEISDITDKLKKSHVVKSNQIIDLTDMFCDKTTCYSFIGGLPVYYNAMTTNGVYNTHITPTYAISLSPFLEQKLRLLKLLQ